MKYDKKLNKKNIKIRMTPSLFTPYISNEGCTLIYNRRCIDSLLYSRN